MSINLLKSKSQDEISEKILLISNKKEALEKAITYSATKAIIEILNNSKIVRSKGILKYKNTIELRYLINLLSVDTDINFKTTNESAFIEIFDIIKSKIENISANPTEDIIKFYENLHFSVRFVYIFVRKTDSNMCFDCLKINLYHNFIGICKQYQILEVKMTQKVPHDCKITT